MTARRTALTGVIGAAVLAACLLVPGLRLGAHHPWLGALVLIVPVAALLGGTGYQHYGPGRAVAVAVAATLAAEGVSWAVALFTLVKALSGEGIAPVWAILLFVTPVVSFFSSALRHCASSRPVRRPRNPHTADVLPHVRVIDHPMSSRARPGAGVWARPQGCLWRS